MSTASANADQPSAQQPLSGTQRFLHGGKLSRDGFRLPRMLLTGLPHDIEAGLKLGFFRYLTKPIKIKEFMDTLNEALEFAEKGKL